TRTSDAAISKYENAAEVQLSSRPSPKPLRSGTPSRQPTGLQAETSDRIGRMAGSLGVGCCLRQAGSATRKRKTVSLTTPDLASVPLTPPTSQHDGASARCSGSNRPDQPSASCRFTPPSTTHSTSSAISYPALSLRVLREEAFEMWRAATAA